MFAVVLTSLLLVSLSILFLIRQNDVIRHSSKPTYRIPEDTTECADWLLYLVELWMNQSNNLELLEKNVADQMLLALQNSPLSSASLSCFSLGVEVPRMLVIRNRSTATELDYDMLVEYSGSFQLGIRGALRVSSLGLLPLAVKFSNLRLVALIRIKIGVTDYQEDETSQTNKCAKHYVQFCLLEEPSFYFHFGSCIGSRWEIKNSHLLTRAFRWAILLAVRRIIFPQYFELRDIILPSLSPMSNFSESGISDKERKRKVAEEPFEG